MIRYTPGRKHRIFLALVNATEAERAKLILEHNLSEEEIKAWRDRLNKGGTPALRASLKEERAAA